MTIVAGTLAADGFELDRLTTSPPAGAAEPIVTVPFTVVLAFPITVVGLTATDTRVGGWTVKVANCFPVPKEP
jgi:hypothetical protein